MPSLPNDYVYSVLQICDMLEFLPKSIGIFFFFYTPQTFSYFFILQLDYLKCLIKPYYCPFRVILYGVIEPCQLNHCLYTVWIQCDCFLEALLNFGESYFFCS